MGESEVEAERKRRWYQVHLWYLFVFVAIVAIGCSWFACQVAVAKKRKKAVETIVDSGGRVYYDYMLSADRDSMLLDPQPPGPAWLREMVGVDFLSDVVRVDLQGEHITDAHVEHLLLFTNLETLYLTRVSMTVDGLDRLRKAFPNVVVMPW
jgi:hypothetical protein